MARPRSDIQPRIVEAARYRFLRAGVDGASLREIAKDAKISKVQASSALNSAIDGVVSSLKKGGKVTLVGFGTFSVSSRKARTGRNPQTGAPLKIAAKKVTKFVAGAELKKAVNRGK